MLRTLTCLISVNPRELSAYLIMECNFFTCFRRACPTPLILPYTHHIPYIPTFKCDHPNLQVSKFVVLPTVESVIVWLKINILLYGVPRLAIKFSLSAHVE